ncbi:MAG: TRAP transporter fused permease subunit [Deltaproteobacteria bacterium]|nr:TRAP transporter fused permease subunit [Deltaproteobacteria bacterium]
MGKEKWRESLIWGMGVCLSLFLLYTSGFGEFRLALQRGFPLLLGSILIFLKFPMIKKRPEFPSGWNQFFLKLERFIDAIFILASCFAIGYVIIFEEELALRIGMTTPLDNFVALVGIICVLEITRRATPSALFIITLACMAYVLLGPYIPGELGHRGYSLGRLVQYLYLSQEGIFGMAMGVMVSIIYVFVLLGAFLEATGAGKFVIDFAYSVTGRLRGGPALSAVVSSAMFGTISGSAVANVTGTGTFTIPLMKRTGYTARFAGAVEAVASTGGMIMPPVMGASAFVMSEILGIPYIKICIAAAVPAILYYICLFVVVYLRAWKEGLRGLPKEELPQRNVIIRESGIFFLPIVLLVILLLTGFTPPYACFFSIISLLGFSLVSKSRLDWKGYLNILHAGARQSLVIFAALAGIGIVIGIISLTGIGVTFSTLITEVAGDSLLLALIMVMIGALILGMGVPPLAAYILMVVVAGSALESLGVPLFIAHMFVFYFGCMAPITPPVALAAYAAAGISGANPIQTGYTATRLGMVGFIVPFMFVYGPPLLMIGSFQEIIMAAVSATVGVVALGIASEGFILTSVKVPLRLILIAGGLALVYPGLITDLIGYGMVLGGLAFHILPQMLKSRRVAVQTGQETQTHKV